MEDPDFYGEIFVSLEEGAKNKDEENVRMNAFAYIGELESHKKRLENKCDRLQVESEASAEKTVRIALNNTIIALTLDGERREHEKADLRL